MVMTGNQIGKELCDALGLPRQTVGFTLRCYTGEVVSVECEYYPEGKEWIKSLAKYHLVRMADGGFVPAPQHPAEAMGFDAWMRKRTDDAHAGYMARHALGGKSYGRAYVSITVDASAMRKDVAEAVRKMIALDQRKRHVED